MVDPCAQVTGSADALQVNGAGTDPRTGSSSCSAPKLTVSPKSSIGESRTTPDTGASGTRSRYEATIPPPMLAPTSTTSWAPASIA